jgi:hypothetical protein
MRAKVDELREYLEAEGYLDPRDPLPPDSVRLRAMAAVQVELRSGLLSAADVDRMLLRLHGPVLPDSTPSGA